MPKQQALAFQTSALQKAIHDNPHFSYIATDSRGVIQIFNVGAERMFGYPAVDVINQITPEVLADREETMARAISLSEEFGGPTLAGLDALLYKASRDIEDITELTYIRRDGTRFPAVVSVTALRDEDGSLIGYLFIGSDNTARKGVEFALNQKHLEVESAREAAEKANRAKSDFLSNMSHELRTPLNAVLGFAQLMETATPQPSVAQKLSIEQILKGGWYLLRLINEILDLALIESGKLMFTMETVELSEVLHDCQMMIIPQARTHNISISFPDDVTPCYIDTDKIRIKQVMINLLSNAIKYNRHNGAVTVSSTITPERRVKVSVTDTGHGLSLEQVGQLFQPFNRLGQERSSTEGTGVGLVVTKQLIELMGGTVGVHSEVGVGSTFWFELPLSTVSVTSASALEQASQIIDRSRIAHPVQHTVLYVEDDPTNLELIGQLIGRRSDLKLLVATTGRAGVQMAQDYLPDLILMDIQLPDISGLEALKIILSTPKTARIPVMALSANAATHNIEQGLKAGFLRYLTKPINLAELMNALDAVLYKVV